MSVPGSWPAALSYPGLYDGPECSSHPAGTSVAQLASIRQMSRQVSRGSAGEYQEDEQAGVARPDLSKKKKKAFEN